MARSSITSTPRATTKENEMSRLANLPPPQPVPFGQTQGVAINKVLRQTYTLLAMTFVCGAIAAYAAATMNVPVVNRWLYLAFAIGMPMLISATRNSVWGLVSCFVYTTGLGFIAGPIIQLYARAIGPEVPMYAFGVTALVFGALSTYAITTKRDFSFMRGFLIAGSMTVLLAIVASFFLQLTWLSLIISSVVVILSSAGILYSTSAAVNGGEDNYIVLAATIYGDVWAMFMSLMRIIGFASSDD
jgi:modulator of FtsH protease